MRKVELKQLPNFVFYLPALVWLATVTYLTLIPGSAIPHSLKLINDKLLHGAIYFATTSLIYLGFIRYNFKNPLARKFLAGIVMAIVLYGGIIELLQHFMKAHRAGDWQDFVANSVGVLLSVLLMRWLHHLRA